MSFPIFISRIYSRILGVFDHQHGRCAEDVGTLDLTIKSSPCPDKLMNPANHVPANSAGN